MIETEYIVQCNQSQCDQITSELKHGIVSFRGPKLLSNSRKAWKILGSQYLEKVETILQDVQVLIVSKNGAIHQNKEYQDRVKIPKSSGKTKKKKIINESNMNSNNVTTFLEQQKLKLQESGFGSAEILDLPKKVPKSPLPLKCECAVKYNSMKKFDSVWEDKEKLETDQRYYVCPRCGQAIYLNDPQYPQARPTLLPRLCYKTKSLAQVN